MSSLFVHLHAFMSISIFCDGTFKVLILFLHETHNFWRSDKKCKTETRASWSENSCIKSQASWRRHRVNKKQPANEISRQMLALTHDWFISAHKSLIDEINCFTLNWNGERKNVWQNEKQSETFPLTFSRRENVSHFEHVSIKKRLRMSRAECATSATLVVWSNFIWSRFLLARNSFEDKLSNFTSQFLVQKTHPAKYNKIYLPQKSIRFIKIGFMSLAFFLLFLVDIFNFKSFSHENEPETSRWSLLRRKNWTSEYPFTMRLCVCLKLGFLFFRRGDKRREKNVEAQNGLAQGNR